jgi:hypothetical protein
MKTPGINNKPFFLILTKDTFNKNDILYLPDMSKIKIIKTYPYNWYRKILNFLHLPFKMCDCVKCKKI